MSTLKTGALRGTSGTADTLTLHASDGSVEIPKLKVGSDAAGDVLYHNGTNYVRLAKGTAGQVLTMNSGATAPEWATAGGGVTDISQWYMSSNYTATASNGIVVNWAEAHGTNYERLGTAPTYSSGTWSLPSTGWWEVNCTCTVHQPTASGDSWGLGIRTSTDSGSNYAKVIVQYYRHSSDGGLQNFKSPFPINSVVKCTNTSTFRFQVYHWEAQANNLVFSGEAYNGSGELGGGTMVIKKLADI